MAHVRMSYGVWLYRRLDGGGSSWRSSDGSAIMAQDIHVQDVPSSPARRVTPLCTVAHCVAHTLGHTIAHTGGHSVAHT
eukprot:3824318-Rhodomonas_salina.1